MGSKVNNPETLRNLLYGYRIRLARFQREKDEAGIVRLTRLIAEAEAQLAQ